MGILGPLLNRKSDLSVPECCYISSSSAPWWITRARRVGPLPAPMYGGYRCDNPSVFTLLIVPHGTYVTGRYTRIWMLRCLPTTSEPWLRALTQKLADVGNPLVRQLGRYLRWPRVDPSPDAKAKGGRGQQASQGHRPRWPSRLNESRSALISRTLFGYPDWGFPWFCSVVRRMPRYRVQSRGTARIPPPQARWLHQSAWKKSHTPSLRQSQSGLRNHTANQAKFIPPTISPVLPRR